MAVVFATRTSDGAPLTFRIERGTLWQDVITLAEETTGAAVDLTGVTSVLMRVRAYRGASAVLLELSTTNGRLEVTDAEAGEITIEVSSADTNTFPAPVGGKKRAKYVYDLMIERSADEWEAGISGKLTVGYSISHPLDDA